MTADTQGRSTKSIEAYLKEQREKMEFLKACSPVQIEQAIAKALAELGLAEGFELKVSIDKLAFEREGVGRQGKSHFEVAVAVEKTRDDFPF